MWFTVSRYLSPVLFVMAILLEGCGFRPLYKAGAGSDSAVLGSVDIARIKDRKGQQLRNLLMAGISPHGRAARADYRLKVTLTETKTGLAIRKDETATRANLTIHAQFELVALRDRSLGTFKGNALSTNSYNILTSDFATLSAENDARDRALRTLAEEIRLRVAAAIGNPQAFSKAAARSAL